MIVKEKKRSKLLLNMYDITVFQTPTFGQDKGYQQVYRIKIQGTNHQDVLYRVFQTLNVKDLLPCDYEGRFLTTGDIVFIDEGMNGHFYYQLKAGGWEKINRVHIR